MLCHLRACGLWPQAGSGTSCASGMICARRRLLPTGTSASFSPCTINTCRRQAGVKVQQLLAGPVQPSNLLAAAILCSCLA